MPPPSRIPVPVGKKVTTTVTNTRPSEPKAKRTTTVVTTKAAPAKGPGKRKKKGSPYLRSLMMPFAGVSAHIPDEHTSASGLCTSLQNLRQAFTNLDSSASYQHSFAVFMAPYPGCAYGIANQTNDQANVLSDTGATGTTISNFVVPNYLSLYGGNPYSTKVRCVSMGIRVTYEGTEQNRAGSVFAGLGLNCDEPLTQPATGTQISMMSGFVGKTKPTLSEIRNSLTQVTECRMVDGVFEARWKPAGIPSYQLYGAGLLGTTNTSGTATAMSLYQAPPGSAGCEAGQNFLVVVIEGDTTATSSTVSNTYNFEMVWNWEVLPDNPTAVAYTISTSRMDMGTLQNALNAVAAAPVGTSRRAAPTQRF